MKTKHSVEFSSIISVLNERSGASSNIYRQTTLAGVFSTQVVQIHGYIEYIVLGTQPFSAVEKSHHQASKIPADRKTDTLQVHERTHKSS